MSLLIAMGTVSDDRDNHPIRYSPLPTQVMRDVILHFEKVLLKNDAEVDKSQPETKSSRENSEAQSKSASSTCHIYKTVNPPLASSSVSLFVSYSTFKNEIKYNAYPR